jgi:F-type H+-transporting ATPase subunit alpha
LLKQPQSQPLNVPEQVAALLAATAGLFDQVPVSRLPAAEKAVREAVTRGLPGVCNYIRRGATLSSDERRALIDTARQAVLSQTPESGHGNH